MHSANSRGKAGRNPGRNTRRGQPSFPKWTFHSFGHKRHSFLHFCLGFNGIHFFPAPFILIEMLHKAETGLTLLFHQAQLWNSRRKFQKRSGLGSLRSPPGGCRPQSVMCEGRGPRKPLPLDPEFSKPPSRVSIHAELLASCLVASPCQPESCQALIPGPAMTRAGSTSTILSQGALASNLTAWQK